MHHCLKHVIKTAQRRVYKNSKYKNRTERFCEMARKVHRESSTETEEKNWGDTIIFEVQVMVSFHVYGP